MGMAKRIGQEKLAGGELDNKQFNDYLKDGPLPEFFDKSARTVHTPHVLKDGADSVGLLGALNRVYLNIGLFSEEWLLHFNPVVGGKTITPIPIATAQKNSSYWQATEARHADTALFFLKAAQPDRLKDAPGGAKLPRGRCRHAGARQGGVRRHLRALPLEQGARPPPASARPDAAQCAGAGYLDCFKRYWAVDARPTTTRRRCARSCRRRRFPRRQLPVDRRAHSGDAAAHQRLQPAGDQRDGRQHLGQLLVAVVQGPALGRHRHVARSVHRRAGALRRCRPAGAATPACRR